MKKRHYYIYKGYWWYSYLYERKVFHETNGLIVKCYTDEEFEKFYGDSCEVWEKVKEDGS